MAILEAQGAAFAAFVDETVAYVAAALNESRRALYEALLLLVAGDPRVLHRFYRLQIDVWASRFRARLLAVLSDREGVAHQIVATHLIALIRRAENTGIPAALFAPGFADLRESKAHGPVVDRFVAQIAETAQREVAMSVLLGQTQAQIADRIAGPRVSAVAVYGPRAALIAKMEAARAYNDAALVGIKAVATLDLAGADPVLKRIDEYTDIRNHPFSRASNGRTADPDAAFRVPVADVAAAARSMGKSAKGVLWPVQGGDYVGVNLPAHFSERGRIVPWRGSWED